MQNKGNKPTVTVIGTGYVGVTTSAILANAGYTVYALDISEDRLQALREGRSFFYEEGMNPLISKAVKAKTLIPTSSYKESIPKSKFIFSCVGTPDNPDGSSNLKYIFAAAKEAAKHIKPESIFIQKSTVPVGTGKKVSKVFEGKNVAYLSNPEFLREGAAVFDTLFFDRIVIGGKDKQALDQAIELYKDIEKSREKIAKTAGIKPKQTKGEYIMVGLDSAELIKVTANAFLALKISFSNSIAQLADKNDADITEVMNAVGADPRIGKAFLNAGRGYGGGCFPKDVTGLIKSAEEHDVDLKIMKSASEINDQMARYIVNKAKGKFGEFKGKKVAVLGLAFKAGTSDARKSPGVKIANILADSGAIVSVYDPEANSEAKKDLNKSIKLRDSWQEACNKAVSVFIATDWPEFNDIDFKQLAKSEHSHSVIDCMNCLDSLVIEKAGLKYVGVGRF